MARKDRYKDSPTLKRDEESGKMTATQKNAERTNDDTEGLVTEEGVPHHARHAVERMTMHSKHEHEHHTHDYGKHGDKKELHGRHESEMKSMHKRHEKELHGEGGGKKGEKEEKHESKGSGEGKEKIEKVEKEKE